MSNDPISVWTVQEHPNDYPESFVARLFRVWHGKVEDTGSIVVSPDLETLRVQLTEMRLCRLGSIPRGDGDIVEVWL